MGSEELEVVGMTIGLVCFPDLSMKYLQYGRFYGTIYCIAAFGVLLTVPVGGELLQAITPQVLIGSYSAVLLTGFICLALSRWALLNWNWRWKVKV